MLIWGENENFTFGPPGIEPGSHEPESCILPLYYGPLQCSRGDLNSHNLAVIAS